MSDFMSLSQGRGVINRVGNRHEGGGGVRVEPDVRALEGSITRCDEGKWRYI